MTKPLDLTGAPWLDDDGEVASQERPTRRRRAVPLDPNDPKTWQEVPDLTPRLKERLRLGGWLAWHVRKQGHRGRMNAHEGIIEAVPPRAGWGVLDWICVPTTRKDNVLWIELKTERGKLTDDQAMHALFLARAGQEVVVLRPRHFFGARIGEPDLAHVRLIEHRVPEGWANVLVDARMTVPEVLRL